MTFRLTLDLDEETRARWQNAAHRYGWTIDRWVRDVCTTASDPESGQVADLRARLTTAETERDYQQAQADEWRDRAFAAKDVLKTANDNCERLDGERAAAEARVEALQPLIEAARLVEALDDSGGQDWWDAHTKLYDALARAALACPPQQRGEQ